MRNFFFILFFTFSLSPKTFSQVIKSTEPSWLSKISYTETNIDINNVEAGTYTLLYDTQVNIPKQTAYFRFATKITDNVGIQEASKINVAFDPTYQQLKFHKINIIRDGEIINKLRVSDFQVMRRELNAENHLYDGSLSAVMHLSDVRTGDIIDFSYSVVGFNPIHNKFSHNFYLNGSEVLEKINVIILSQKALNIKSFNTSVEPKNTEVNGLYKYQWATTQTKAVSIEENVPAWKLIYENVLLSEYNSWKEVIDWGVGVYEIKDKIGKDLKGKIDEIINKNKTNGDRIKATLNFVQNDIRYLGLESGIGAYKPFSPNQVFEQRFGDCKDKSLLMTTMLNEMGIEAYPMLVNTTLKQTIKELLPSPKFFDHCVVKVIDGNALYYDPTISNQGGDYDSTHFPNYVCGLVLKPGNDKLDEFKAFSENKIITDEEFTIEEIGKGAKLKITTTYYEAEADIIRNYFKNNSINSIQKEYEHYYSSYYYNVSSIAAPKTEDNLYSNIFKVYEEYQLDSIWQPMPLKEGHISVNFTPSSLSGTLFVPTKDQRKHEVSVLYPIIREHKTKIKLPTHWNIENEKIFVNSPGFYYEWQASYNRTQKEIDLYYYLETQKDHVSVDEYKQYVQDIKKVDQASGYSIFIPENFSTSNAFVSNSGNDIFNGITLLFKGLFILGIIVAVILLIFWQVNKSKKDVG